MSSGYIYCFSNESMPGIFKIGMTERTPEERLKEANATDTWRPPTPYKIEIAKKVINPMEKEKAIHNILEKYKDRINPNREFFRSSIDIIKMFFNIMDGEIWCEKVKPVDTPKSSGVCEILLQIEALKAIDTKSVPRSSISSPLRKLLATTSPESMLPEALRKNSEIAPRSSLNLPDPILPKVPALPSMPKPDNKSGQSATVSKVNTKRNTPVKSKRQVPVEVKPTSLGINFHETPELKPDILS